MEGKENISDYRSKLDKTLLSPDLTNYEMIHTLVKNQMLQSLDGQLEEYTEDVVERRSKDMSNFLSMLRSASVNDVESSKSSEEPNSGWKVKQDTDEFRVMYREGPEGTPYHTLLVEGYVDGPLDVCLCISCESDLYKKWWPQSAIPTFKVMSSQCVQKIRIGEQISLVRMKVSWPLSSREALVHYFALEYFQDGLIVVLLNSISDSETIDRSTHGFTRDGIPDAEDVVRIDVVGGFALQKVTADRSYFRTIANMDIKLDFIPPAFMNFISRQLVGSGFKLYKKEIASVSKGDGKFREALKDPLYTRIHEALYSQNTPLASPALENPKSTSIMPEEQRMEACEDNSAKENNEVDEIEQFEESESLDKGTQKSFDNVVNSITEVVKLDEAHEAVISDEVEQTLRTTHDITEHFGPEIKTKVGLSPEVQQALGTLEKAISILREYNSNPGKDQSDVKKGHLTNFEKEAGEESISLEADQIRRKNEACGESRKIELTETSHESNNSSENHGSRNKGSNSYTRETNQSKIAPASPDEGFSSPSHIKHIDSHSSMKQITVSKVYENMTENYSLNADANNGNGDRVTKRKNKKPRFCCLSFASA
ncbi:hypothetical protein DH2020_026444 [Rehmannia glutinosa]|uniref:START domain-containing protein n=1 Tax=Rehmannia glutinosa TaxID=99300 RepID=A0ABR0VWW4_REHGL